jgi:hypothetical protein
MKAENAKKVLAGVSALALLASFTPNADKQAGKEAINNLSEKKALNAGETDNSVSLNAFDLFTSEGYTLLNYYYGGGLGAQIAGTYAAATQGALWGMVYGGPVGFGVGLALGI